MRGTLSSVCEGGGWAEMWDMWSTVQAPSRVVRKSLGSTDVFLGNCLRKLQAVLPTLNRKDSCQK